MAKELEAASEADSLINDADREIIEHQLNGVDDDKEAADVAVSRMLKEEAAAGRGKEQYEADDEGGAPKDAEAETDDKLKSTEEQRKRAEEETRSQRRSRQRRENESRRRSEMSKAEREIGRLQERVKQLEAKRPDPDNYGDNTADYVADRAGLAAQHASASQEIEEVQAELRELDSQSKAERAEAFADYLAAGSKKYADFERVLKGDGLPFTGAMVDALMDEDMIDIAYELAKQPDEVARIAALPTTALQIKEILRAQASLQAKAAERTISRAPPPVKPVKGAGAAPGTKRPEDMNNEDYFAMRRKQLAQQRN